MIEWFKTTPFPLLTALAVGGGLGLLRMGLVALLGWLWGRLGLHQQPVYEGGPQHVVVQHTPRLTDRRGPWSGSGGPLLLSGPKE